MKKMLRTMKLFVTVSMSIFLLPLMAGAQDVSWVSQNYTATANSSRYSSYDTNTEANPPVNAYAFGGLCCGAEANILNSEMYVRAWAGGAENSSATAEFAGTYVSATDLISFLFSYSLMGSPIGYSAWLTLYDVTDNSTLYNGSLEMSTADIVVNTIAGHTISVDFGISVARNAERDISGTDSLTLTYNTAIAPEPISFVLFITGGTILAGRMYLKRKKIA